MNPFDLPLWNCDCFRLFDKLVLFVWSG